MSWQAMAWAFRTPISNVGAKFVLLALAEHAREDATSAWSCFPSVKRLASFTAQSERTVERHLAWLVENGWIHRYRRSQAESGGAYAYTLQPDNVSDQHSDLTRHIDGGDPTKTTGTPDNLAAAHKKEPARKPTIKPMRQEDADFDVWWAEYPLKVEKLGARAAYRRIVDEGRASTDELVAGAHRYAAEVRERDQRMIKHPTRWLNLGCWDDEAPGPHLRLVETAPVCVDSFEGPEDLWKAAVTLKGEAWAMSWLAPCRWDGDGSRLLARTGFAAGTIAQELRIILRSFGVQTGVAAPLATAGARAAPNDLRASEGVVSTPSLRSGAGA